MFFSKPIIPALLCSAFLLTGCSVFEILKQRLAVFGTSFSAQHIDVSGLVYPSNWLSASLDVLSRDKSLLSQFGVDVRVSIKAVNNNAQRAVFDGATGFLQVMKTGASDPSASGLIPAFTVEPNSQSVIGVTFPLRLNQPVFSKSVWKAIVRGDDIPYHINADLKFNLLSPLGVPDSIGSRTIRMSVAKGSVQSKSGGSALERILSLIEKAL